MIKRFYKYFKMIYVKMIDFLKYVIISNPGEAGERYYGGNSRARLMIV